MLHESNEKAVRLRCRNARRGHFICGEMQFRTRSGWAPLQRRRRRRCVTICISVHRTNERTSAAPQNENLPFKSHFASTYFLSLSVAMSREAGEGAALAGYRKFPSPSESANIRFVYSLCAAIRIKFVRLFPSSPFSLTPPSLGRTLGQIPEQPGEHKGNKDNTT